jgi:type VI secretion system protein ImpE
MKGAELLREGKLTEAVEAAGAALRSNPADARSRTFLFELLCFAGDYERAQKHLEVLAGGGKDAATGALLYHAALHAERERQRLFETKEYPRPAEGSPLKPVSGTLNGKPFQSISDADPRVGPRLEIFAAGSFLWIPMEHVAEFEIQEPKRLRDLIWAPALIRTGPGFQAMELGEVLTPVLTPHAWQYDDDEVRLGRATVWGEEEDGLEIPFGQKLLLVDGDEVPYLEVRKLVIQASAETAQS